MGLTKNSTIIFRLLFVFALVVITWLATIELTYPHVENINDKISHIAAFYILALLSDFSFPNDNFGLNKVSALLVYGLLLEMIQYFLPYRTFSLLDLMADGIGLAGYFFSLPLLKFVPFLRMRWYVHK